MTTVIPVSKQTTISDPLVWIGCEMAGLNQGADAFIEVAAVITDYKLKPPAGGIDILIRPPATALEQVDDYMCTIHTFSDLLAALEDEVTMETARSVVLNYTTSLVPEPRTAQLAGDSAGMDKTFLARDMPELIEHLHYRIMDVSSLKGLAKRWYPRTFFHAPKKVDGHRVLADILESVDELCYHHEVLFPAGEGPSSQEYKDVAERILSTPTR